MNKPLHTIPIRQLPEVLTPAEIEAIEQECSHYEHRDAAAIEAMKLVQNNRGWINDDCLLAIAAQLNMPAAQLEGVATFYNHIYRQPVGRYVIHLCDSIACHLLRYQAIAKHLQNLLNIEFGETTQDNKFTLLTNPCLGACDKAPALMVNGEIYEAMTIDATTQLIERLVKESKHG